MHISLSSMIAYSFCHFLIIIVLLGLAIFIQLGTSRSKVEVLPGFEGPLPFKLETGYVGLGESHNDMQVFYYFIKSENDPEKDPLMLWLSGGPGCSSISGLLFQFGPLAFDTDLEEYDETGSLPNLILRPQSWTKVCSIIFVDLPFGTGFSYAKNLTAQRSDWKLVHHTHQFLRKWLSDHPEFISNEFYMGADSYSGIPGPAIVLEISNGNEIGLQPPINLQGYLLGNPITTRKEKNHKIPFAHGMGLISDELYASLQRNCRGEYVDIDSRNELCSRDINYFEECLSKLNVEHILKPCYKDDLPKAREAQWRRSLIQEPQLVPCKGTIGKWERCYKTDFENQISNSFEFHVNLSAKGYRSLIFSGDHDALVPFISTQAWIRALNYSIVEDWRPWLQQGQVAGYTRTYSNRMSFATVKGSGHIATQYNPEECFTMFTRWIANVPL
ncbi:serine carboxypeptidase-like 11 isoform X2 [Cajanus cajan]|uniref:serine carboxypeptidase-like 11 isoform X2 n=1 Tax=Cajanus cajan TaxID=3821 RepID=UPI0010FAE0C1|nr:serine carboxypeptidase-like 11 isoform X2 [Cajanus cajan]